MNTLDPVARELRAYAERHPWRGFPRVPRPEERRDLDWQGIPLRVQFTYGIYPTGKRAWHLSAGDRREIPMPADLVEALLLAFFPDVPPREMPSVTHPGIIRQWVVIAAAEHAPLWGIR